MTDFLTALGLMFVIEGSLYALFPDATRKMMLSAIQMPQNGLRMVGLGLALFGFLIVAVLRGF